MVRRLVGALVVSVVLCSQAWATESGGSYYAQGPEGFLVAAVPPPGSYFINYNELYFSSRFNDGSGRSMIPGFNINVVAEIVRYAHVTNVKILGGNWIFQGVVPLVHLDVSSGETSQTRNGLAGITVSPLYLGWHLGDLNVVVGADVNLPTGRYSQNDLANIGRNYWNVEPVVAVTYLAPQGLELSAKFMYDFNFENGSGNFSGVNPTGASYRSGQEFHVDFAGGWRFGSSWELGLHGYCYVQTTKDKIGDASANEALDTLYGGFRGRAFALGPGFRYSFKPVQIFASLQKEVYTRYRPEGDKFWLKIVVPFS